MVGPYPGTVNLFNAGRPAGGMVFSLPHYLKSHPRGDCAYSPNQAKGVECSGSYSGLRRGPCATAQPCGGVAGARALDPPDNADHPVACQTLPTDYRQQTKSEQITHNQHRSNRLATSLPDSRSMRRFLPSVYDALRDSHHPTCTTTARKQ